MRRPLPIYAVEFPPSPLVRDGHAYRLHVTERDRLAYLHTRGGIAGWYTVRSRYGNAFKTRCGDKRALPSSVTAAGFPVRH